MKCNRFIVFFILILLLFSISSMDAYARKCNTGLNEKKLPVGTILKPLPDDQVDQEQKYDDGFFWGVYGTNVMLAQSFRPTMNVITKVELLLKINGNPDGLGISIRKTKTSEDLTTIYIESEDIAEEPGGTWVEFDFQDVLIDPGATYYIIWKPYGADAFYNTFYWGLKDDNPYEQGTAWEFLQNEWEKLEPDLPKGDPDFCFKQYGMLNSPPSQPTKPEGPSIGNVGDELSYTSSFCDSDNDHLSVLFDWGDGTYSGWIKLGSESSLSQTHSYNKNGSYKIKAKAKDLYFESSWSEMHTVIIGNLAPEKPTRPSGPTNGKILVTQKYMAASVDYNDDNLFYQWNWSDGALSKWIGPYKSGEPCEITHLWTQQGSYEICVRAKDTYNHTSGWSDPLAVTMPKHKSFHSSLFSLLNNFLSFSKIIQPFRIITLA